MKIVFSPDYAVEMPGHVFATEKFLITAKNLESRGYVSPGGFVKPEIPSRELLRLAHTSEWADKVFDFKLTKSDADIAELPLDKRVCRAHLLGCSGVVLSCEIALDTGLGLHCGGGGHHARREHGAGFCLLNDIAVGVESMLSCGRIKRAVVIDLDVHQGDGTALIFSGRQDVFTFSMHRRDIYPDVKQKSSLDIELEKGCTGTEYMSVLRVQLTQVLDVHKPELVVYLAGADCYKNDRLGGLDLSEDDMIERDRFVFEQCFAKKIPVAVALGGGYAEDACSTARIHTNTLEQGILCWRKMWRK